MPQFTMYKYTHVHVQFMSFWCVTNYEVKCAVNGLVASRFKVFVFIEILCAQSRPAKETV